MEVCVMTFGTDLMLTLSVDSSTSQLVHLNTESEKQLTHINLIQVPCL